MLKSLGILVLHAQKVRQRVSCSYFESSIYSNTPLLHPLVEQPELSCYHLNKLNIQIYSVEVLFMVLSPCQKKTE